MADKVSDWDERLCAKYVKVFAENLQFTQFDIPGECPGELMLEMMLAKQLKQ